MTRDLVSLLPGDDGSVSVVFDEPGRPVNVLRGEVFDALSRVLDEVEQMDPPPSRVLFTSGKPGTFIAGADLKVIRDATDGELDALLKQGQDVLNRVARLPMPTVAVLNGAALGGGLEVALACDARVAAADGRPVFGLPEVTLGLIPGWGGTVRLPCLVGVEAAVRLMWSGRVLTPAEALAVGLVDAVVDAGALEAAAQAISLPVQRDPIALGDVVTHIALGLKKRKPPEGAYPRPDKAGLKTEELYHPARQMLVDVSQQWLYPLSEPGHALRAGCEKISADDPVVAMQLRQMRLGLALERWGLVECRNTDEGRELIRRFFDRKKK